MVELIASRNLGRRAGLSLAEPGCVQQSLDALIAEEGVRLDEGKGLGHDHLRDGKLPDEASEVGPQGPQVLVVSCSDLEVARQQPRGLTGVGPGSMMDQQPSDLLNLAWGWGRRREEPPGSVAGLDHDHRRTVARLGPPRWACPQFGASTV